MNLSTPYLALKYLFLSFFSSSPQIKYESRHTILSAMANYWDFRVHTANLMWTYDPEYLSHWQHFDGDSGKRIHERRFNLYYLAKSTRLLPGDTAECGVLFGAGSFMIMKATAREGRVHHIFDSFQGLSKPGNQDDVKEDRTFKWEEGDLSVNEITVKRNLTGHGNFTTYQGWIPSRFDEVSNKIFSFVHIDVDLYQPTYDSLEFFYKRMTRGGIIVCDDYGSEACPGAYKALNEFISDKPEDIIHLTGGQGVIIKTCQ